MKRRSKYNKKRKIRFKEIVIIALFIVLDMLCYLKLISFTDLVQYVIEIMKIYKGLA